MHSADSQTACTHLTPEGFQLQARALTADSTWLRCSAHRGAMPQSNTSLQLNLRRIRMSHYRAQSQETSQKILGGLRICRQDAVSGETSGGWSSLMASITSRDGHRLWASDGFRVQGLSSLGFRRCRAAHPGRPISHLRDCRVERVFVVLHGHGERTQEHLSRVRGSEPASVTADPEAPQRASMARIAGKIVAAQRPAMISNLQASRGFTVLLSLWARSKARDPAAAQPLIRPSQGAPARHTRPFAPTSSTNCQRDAASAASSSIVSSGACALHNSLRDGRLASFLQLAGVSAPVETSLNGLSNCPGLILLCSLVAKGRTKVPVAIARTPSGSAKAMEVVRGSNVEASKSTSLNAALLSAVDDACSLGVAGIDLGPVQVEGSPSAQLRGWVG